MTTIKTDTIKIVQYRKIESLDAAVRLCTGAGAQTSTVFSTCKGRPYINISDDRVSMICGLCDAWVFGDTVEQAVERWNFINSDNHGGRRLKLSVK